MICRLSLTAPLTLILAACSAEVDELPPLEQAHAALQRGDGYLAEVRLRDESLKLEVVNATPEEQQAHQDYLKMLAKVSGDVVAW